MSPNFTEPQKSDAFELSSTFVSNENFSISTNDDLTTSLATAVDDLSVASISPSYPNVTLEVQPSPTENILDLFSTMLASSPIIDLSTSPESNESYPTFPTSAMSLDGSFGNSTTKIDAESSSLGPLESESVNESDYFPTSMFESDAGSLQMSMVEGSGTDSLSIIATSLPLLTGSLNETEPLFTATLNETEPLFTPAISELSVFEDTESTSPVEFVSPTAAEMTDASIPLPDISEPFMNVSRPSSMFQYSEENTISIGYSSALEEIESPTITPTMVVQEETSVLMFSSQSDYPDSFFDSSLDLSDVSFTRPLDVAPTMVISLFSSRSALSDLVDVTDISLPPSPTAALGELDSPTSYMGSDTVSATVGHLYINDKKCLLHTHSLLLLLLLFLFSNSSFIYKCIELPFPSTP